MAHIIEILKFSITDLMMSCIRLNGRASLNDKGNHLQTFESSIGFAQVGIKKETERQNDYSVELQNVGNQVVNESYCYEIQNNTAHLYLSEIDGI